VAYEIKKINKADQKRIAETVRGLASDPFPEGFGSVVGLPGFWRVKCRDYRIVYTTNEDDQTIVVGRIAHRREVYKRLADVTAAMKTFSSRR